MRDTPLQIVLAIILSLFIACSSHEFLGVNKFSWFKGWTMSRKTILFIINLVLTFIYLKFVI